MTDHEAAQFAALCKKVVTQIPVVMSAVGSSYNGTGFFVDASCRVNAAGVVIDSYMLTHGKAKIKQHVERKAARKALAEIAAKYPGLITDAAREIEAGEVDDV
jgi:hypothetical protein